MAVKKPWVRTFNNFLKLLISRQSSTFIYSIENYKTILLFWRKKCIYETKLNRLHQEKNIQQYYLYTFSSLIATYKIGFCLHSWQVIFSYQRNKSQFFNFRVFHLLLSHKYEQMLENTPAERRTERAQQPWHPFQLTQLHCLVHLLPSPSLFPTGRPPAHWAPTKNVSTYNCSKAMYTWENDFSSISVF